MPVPAQDRRFLMLQGPHGPFFAQLGDQLRNAGCTVWRVGFNRGDEMFWRRPGYLPFCDDPARWPEAFAGLLGEKAITDIVLYGDSRPVHAEAVRAAKLRGLRVHVFEEGYLRPYWVTYERGGSNGNSRLMDISLADMSRALALPGADQPQAPARWGDMREHMFYGALYHFFVMAMNRRYRHFRPHRGISVVREFRLYLRRFLLIPVHKLERAIASWVVRRGGFAYHLVLLQLEHDASFRAHSDFDSQADFIDLCLSSFADGAPSHHHLVFKAHPLEDGRIPVRRLIAEGAARHGLCGRVHFVRGGKLAGLLNGARSAVTVNSTAGQQALWRGIALRAFGRAVYDKPGLVSPQPLARFFADPARPDPRAYRDFRQFLLETSQVPGGFYASRSRRHLLRQVVDMMLAASDPYEMLLSGKAAPRQQLHAVN